MEENILKKVVAIFVALSILISTLSLTSAFADGQKDISDKTKKVIVVYQKEKRESLFSKISNKFKNLVFKLNLTAFYYYLVTIGLVNLFEKLEIFKAEEVYSKFKFGDVLSSIWLNAKSFPGCIKLIYNEIKNSNKNLEVNQVEDEYFCYKEKNLQSQVKLSDEEDRILNICDIIQRSTKQNKLGKSEYDILENANSMENLTCSIINSMKTIKNPEKSILPKFSEILKSLDGSEKDSKNLWNYLKTHGTLIWISSVTGSIIGLLGSIIGAINFGWLYGTLMIPYLFSFKDPQKGEFAIIANGIDLIYNNVLSFFNTINESS